MAGPTLYDTFGNEVKYRISKDVLEAYLENATIKFPLPEASSTLLEDIVDFTSIDPMELDTLMAKLSNIGFKKANAKAMASILIQVSRQEGVSPLSYFNLNEKSLKLANDTYNTINLLRPAGNRIGVVSRPTNRQSRANKLIKP